MSFDLLSISKFTTLMNIYHSKFTVVTPLKLSQSIKKETFDACNPNCKTIFNSKWLSIYRNVENVPIIIKWLASIKSSLLLNNYLQRTQTLEVN